MQTCGQDSRQVGQEKTKRDKHDVRLWWGRRGGDGGSSDGDSMAREKQRVGTTADDDVGLMVDM